MATILGNSSSEKISLSNETISFTSVSNILTVSSGINIIYPDLYDLTDSGTNDVLTFASNTIIVGDASGTTNTIFGTLYDLIITGNDSFSFAGNTVIAGNGNDTLYGTLHDLSLTGNSGGLSSLTFCGNSVTASEGNDTLYGTLQDITISLTGSNNENCSAFHCCGNPCGQNSYENHGQNAGNSIQVYTISFAANTVTAADGKDVLYGTLHDINVTVTGPSTGEHEFTFGSSGTGNSVSAGAGCDTLYGTLHDINISVSGTSTTSCQSGNNYQPSCPSQGCNVSNFGCSGSENNNQSHHCNQQDSYNTQCSGFNNFCNGGESQQCNSEYGNNSGGIVGSNLTGDTFSFGSNSVVAGDGNDCIYGTMQDFSLAACGQNDVISGTSAAFGNNFVAAGAGNDSLSGTLHDVSLSATTGASICGTTLQFESNFVAAGNGNDTLYSGMRDLVINIDNASKITGTTINFGDNQLYAGSGTDTLVGELNHIDISGETISQFLSQNTINPGVNTFTAGSGQDTFVFDPAIDIGVNTINNFNPLNDILEFNNTGSTLNDLINRIASVESDSSGNGTEIDFKAAPGDSAHTNGGMIDITNVAYVPGASIHNTLLNLVEQQASHITVAH